MPGLLDALCVASILFIFTVLMSLAHESLWRGRFRQQRVTAQRPELKRVQGNLKSSLLKHNNDFTACKAQLMTPSPKFTLTLSYIVTMQGVAKIKKPKKWETPCMILSFR
ncbi:MAG: hypothetical protein CMJ91_03945 [Planctomycetes bacterium]|nr:hypothetical protein [Planctomycetota bacterium]